MTETPTFQVIDIIKGTTVDGPGFRTSIYFAGCSHHCEGCHNPITWDFNSGQSRTIEELMAVIREEDFDVTLSGGDPLFQALMLPALIKSIKEEGHSVWLYTGFTWEQIMVSPPLLDAVKNVEVVVDGPYIQRLRNPDLLFRGSSNQRLIDVRDSLSTGEIRIWGEEYI